MTGTLQIETPGPQRQEGRRFPLLLLVASVVIAVSLAFYFWPGALKPRSAATRQPHLPFGPVQQAYAAKIQIENVSLSRAENFYHQEVTTFSGEVINTGDRPLKNVELTILFFDELHQLVLRETRILFSWVSAPIPPGGRREFEVSFEHIPSSWNMQQPSLSITGVQFASAKE